MTKVIYMVEVRGLIPESLPRKVIEAHARALKSNALSHPQHGKEITKSEP